MLAVVKDVEEQVEMKRNEVRELYEMQAAFDSHFERAVIMFQESLMETLTL